MSIDIHVRNIKVSFRTIANCEILHKVAKNNPLIKTITPSFFVWKIGYFSFIIYFKGHINVTGIRVFSEIYKCSEIIQQIKGVLKIKNISIDNITFSGSLQYSLPNFFPFIQFSTIQSGFESIQFSQELFPGAQFRIKQKGTLILFRSGKFNIVGVKEFEHALLLTHTLLTDLENFNKNNNDRRL